MENPNEPYFFQSARENGMTIKEYLNLPDNYVIMENGKPLTEFRDNVKPCVFSGVEEALNELKQWNTPIRNVSIIPEKEYIINTYGENCWNALALGRGLLWQAMDDDDWDCHDGLQNLLKAHLPAGSDVVKFERRFSEIFADMLDTLQDEFCK